jgi:ubiquinone/menaquinone biosynthesis C-methylase UbiE
MKQRIDEWTKTYNDDYFNRQFKTPYRSTIKFCDWLEQLGVLTANSKSNILDIATGKGATLCYMKQRFPGCSYTGIDINNDFIQEGKQFFEQNKVPDCKLEYGDLYHLDFAALANRFDGVVMLQTLSWLPEYENALTEIAKLNPKWLALTSLFYDGLVECKTEIREHERSDNQISDGRANALNTSYYNTYSLPRVKEFLAQKGYRIFKYTPFEIDTDLPKPKHTHMQTYTETLQNGKRLQISGPILMNWHFICAQK